MFLSTNPWCQSFMNFSCGESGLSELDIGVELFCDGL